jgi:hypothetical protein
MIAKLKLNAYHIDILEIAITDPRWQRSLEVS